MISYDTFLKQLQNKIFLSECAKVWEHYTETSLSLAVFELGIGSELSAEAGGWSRYYWHEVW